MDAELLIYSLLSGRFPQAYVTDAPDIDAINRLPMIVYQATTGSRVSNADKGNGETWIVALSIVSGSRVEAKDLSLEVSDSVGDWFGASVAGAGYVAYVDETSLFTRAPQEAIEGDDLTQYNAVFTLIIRP